MCAACVAQGAVYVGGAVGSLRVMAARASSKRRRAEAEAEADPTGVADETVGRTEVRAG